ncbi:DNA polymerase III subunit alpha [Argonema antarcticum]|uniref:DNA polymerase III subunit alpha n=1 Tax=Argonema antarcticum TaxID=2942763 RepID=UPI002011AF6E|nr:DNA polymerase III subunit alpha [Argonema antarcticum]MCL1469512.1 DNA polymerase III subunit alpha [Argonema antarcticum A004/B2]
MSFIGLHTHSDYSLLDGASQLPDLVERAVELGMPAIALTDHGVMYGAIELIKVCRTKNIKPIIGNEMYVVNGDIEKQERGRKKYHQIVLAKNQQGYKNLVKLTTISHLKGVQGKGIFSRPCINKELLEQYREGLIVTSGCRAGEVPQLILQSKLKEARDCAKWYKELFGKDYYLEIQDHGYLEDRIVNVEIVKIGKELEIKVVATNDSHFTECSDVEAHDALLCINTKQLISDEKRMRYSGTEYLKSAEEMAHLFRDHLSDDVIQNAIANTQEVANKVEPYNILGEARLPDYPDVPSGHTPDTYVQEKAWEGLLERLNTKSRSDINPVYKERLEYELTMIERMGFSTYFLVVWDYIKYARDNQIPVGPGRGSAAGSLVAYVLKITNIDPVHHGLLFERFLNPERKSMPDIDTDFCIERRDDVIKYVTKKYGADRVAQIITFNRLTSKAVLKDVARVLDIPYKESDEMAKLIPVVRGKPTKLKVMISNDTPAPEFKDKYDNDDKVRRWVDMAMRIEGTNKTFGVHAAGVVISAQPLDEVVPLQKNNDGSVITQYFMEDLESLGLLKMDFLGLRNLTIIQNTIDLIKQTHGHRINPDDVTADERKSYKILSKGEQNKRPRDVENTYKKLESGDLEGIFQLESSGMLDVVAKLKPSSIEDISSILALYRPGPLDAGLIPKFIDRKHGREAIEYEDKALEPILNETYGIIVYQEQIMKIAQDLAGYSLGQADLLRRCLSGSTKIVDATTGRLVSLSEIAAKPEYWLGRKVFSLDLDRQKITQKPITEIHHNGVKAVWEIITKTNRKIRATDDHLFYTLLGWKPLKDFKVSDRIGLAKTLPIAHTSEISDAQIKLTAYLIGDGHLSTKSPACSYFCNSDRELIADFNHCAEELFGSPAPVDHQLHFGRKSVTYARIGFISAFNGWVDSHIKRAHSRDKEIPSWVFSLSKSQLQLFLGTLWSTDGSFDTAIGHTDYTSTSELLIIQIQHLLLRLGIVALFNVKRIKYQGNPHVSYRAQITGREDMLKFCELIQPYLSSSKSQQAQLCYVAIKDKLPNQSKHSIPPEVIKIIANAKKASGMTWAQIDQAVGATSNKMSSGLNFHKTPTRSLARHRIRNFATAFQHPELMTIADSEIFWDEIIAIEYVGEEEVFDLTIAETHNLLANDFIAHNCMGKKKADEMQKQRENFIEGSTKNGIKKIVADKLFDQMVLFAEYCFNKSHSTAYAYVTYQTAYLKANYPEEYMAALLTANSDDQDKVKKYIGNCQGLGITVEGPDINRSQINFTPSKGKILFGLSAVKTVGEGAIANILAARQEGPFTSLPDLCDRINLHTVNSRALESLIKCGALDSISANRKQLIEYLPLVVNWTQKSKETSEQPTLFDLGSVRSPAPKIPEIDDFPLKEKSEFEQELLGFYLSYHPLKSAAKVAKREGIDPINLSQIDDYIRKGNVTAIVMLKEVKQIVTKKDGRMMAILQIEDLEGQQAPAVVFPDTYEKISSLLVTNTAVILFGKVGRDQKDEQTQLMVNDAKPLETETLAEETSLGLEDDLELIVMLQLTLQQVNDEEQLKRLKDFLKEYSGETDKAKVPVMAIVAGQDDRQLVSFGQNFWVQDPQGAVSRLQDAGFPASTQPPLPV